MSELAADSKKIILVELDIGNRQDFWANWSAWTYYVDFDAVYDRIDPSLLVGVGASVIDDVGSVSADAVLLRKAANVAAVEAEDNTFYWGAAERRVYIRLAGGRPSFHRMLIGMVYGIADRGGFYGGMLYEGRLLSAPRLTKSRDPLFWGRLAFEGGTLTIENSDGKFDNMAEELNVFGNPGRIYYGFDDEERSEFRQLYTGTIGPVKIGTASIEVQLVDMRTYLNGRVPDGVFRVADYPNLKDSNEGKSIPIGYGRLRNVPAMCTNEAQAPAPANYDFKLFDMSHHLAIHAINTVYVDGEVKAPAATDLINATFALAAANYKPGQRVTADCEGYEDDDGNLIENALDVIVDLFYRWWGVLYSGTSYDQAAWDAARAAAPDICYHANKPTEANKIIEDIAATVRGLFLVDRFGRYSFRIPNPAAYPIATIEAHQALDEPAMEYQPDEVIGVVLVGYDKDWSEDDHLYLRDDSRQAEISDRYNKVAPERTFDTLLVDEVDAQAYATGVLEANAYVRRPFSRRCKLGGAIYEIGDILKAVLRRRGGGLFIGTVKAELIGIEYDLTAAEQTLQFRVIEVLPVGELYTEGSFIGDTYYGDSFYGVTKVA